jgi:hypothetical protein
MKARIEAGKPKSRVKGAIVAQGFNSGVRAPLLN